MEINDQSDQIALVHSVEELLAAGEAREPTSSNATVLSALSDGDGRFGFLHVAKCLGQVTEIVEKSDETSSRAENTPRRTYRYISNPFLRRTLLGRCDYPLWHIANSPRSFDHQDTLLILACACFDEVCQTFGRGPDDIHQNLRVLEALFERGWLSLGIITNFVVCRYRNLWSGSPGHSSDLTLWHHFLVKALMVRYYPTYHTIADKYIKRQTQHDGKLFHLFLRFNPGTEF